MTHENAKRIVNQTFWEIKVGDVDRTRDFNCATIVRNRKAHQVWSIMCRDPTMLEYRNNLVFVLNVKILQHLFHVNKYMFLFSLVCFILKCIQDAFKSSKNTEGMCFACPLQSLPIGSFSKYVENISCLDKRLSFCRWWARDWGRWHVS